MERIEEGVPRRSTGFAHESWLWHSFWGPWGVGHRLDLEQGFLGASEGLQATN